MSKYEEPESNEWVQPIRNGYKLACCDCGLVHDIDFRPVKLDYDRKNKIYEATVIPKAAVIFRVRRNNRATAGIRRGMKKNVRRTK